MYGTEDAAIQVLVSVVELGYSVLPKLEIAPRSDHCFENQHGRERGFSSTNSGDTLIEPNARQMIAQIGSTNLEMAAPNSFRTQFVIGINFVIRRMEHHTVV